MTSSSLDRLLAILVLAMAATGLLTMRAGSPETGWLFTLHDLLAGALAVAIAMKVRRSLPAAIGDRRWGRDEAFGDTGRAETERSQPTEWIVRHRSTRPR